MEATSTSKRYSGRVIDAAVLEQIRGILRAHAGASRQQLSYRVCEVLDGRKPDGSLKDMSCRVALLRLYREGLIELPAPRRHYEAMRSYARRTPQGELGADPYRDQVAQLRAGQWVVAQIVPARDEARSTIARSTCRPPPPGAGRPIHPLRRSTVLPAAQVEAESMA